jgi:hypothetical protein
MQFSLMRYHDRPSAFTGRAHALLDATRAERDVAARSIDVAAEREMPTDERAACRGCGHPSGSNSNEEAARVDAAAG